MASAKRPLFLFFLLLTVLSTASALAEGAKVDASSICESYLQKNPEAQTLSSLQRQVNEILAEVEATSPSPRFIDIEVEKEISWPGVQGPQALTELLPEGGSFKAAPAPGAESGYVVKLLHAEHSFPLRLEIPWREGTTSTSVYVSLPNSYSPQAQAQNEQLIDSQYEYVVWHIHGGGTPTATGVNAMSIGSALAKKGIPVIGADMPGHGLGDRNVVPTVDEILEWNLALIEKLVDPNVKVILSGHSWGGEFAAAMHRLSNDPRYARIHKYIALSPPVDPSLGGSPRERAEMEENFREAWRDYENEVAPSDYEFTANVVMNGKISPVATWFTSMTSMSYSLPPLTAEEAEALKPLLVIVGEADGLVGYPWFREQFDQAFGTLSSGSEYIVLGPGTTFESSDHNDLLPTGHQIFDVYEPGTSDYLVYNKMFEFIVGEQAAADWSATAETNAQSREALVHQIFQLYANNFVFREYVRHRVEYVRRPHPNEMGPLMERKKALEKYIKKPNKEGVEIPAGIESVEQAKSELTLLKARLDGRYIPEGNEELAAMVGDIEVLVEELNLLQRGGSDREGLKQLEKEWHNLLKQRDRLTRQLKRLWENDQLTTPAITAANEEVEQKLEVLGDLYTQLNEAHGGYLLEAVEKGEDMAQVVANMPAPLRETIQEFDVALQDFNATREGVHRLQLEETVKGAFDQESGDKPSEWVAELVGDGNHFLQTGEVAEGSLEARIEAVEARIDGLQDQVARLRLALSELEMNYNQALIATGETPLYEIEPVEVWKLLDQPAEELMAALEANPNAAQALKQLLRNWDGIWGEVVQTEAYQSIQSLRAGVSD